MAKQTTTAEPIDRTKPTVGSVGSASMQVQVPIHTQAQTQTQASAPAQAAGAGQQRKDYIGCVMSLISKQEIRYVGTLVMINSKEHTLVLQNVKSYGTEGRQSSYGHVPASQRIYEHIVFKADELKDFSVIKSPEPVFKDPAILTCGAPQEAAKPESPEKKVAEPPAKKEEPRTEVQPAALPDQPVRSPEPTRYTRPRGSPRGNSRRYAGATGAKESGEYEEEYDFVMMNEKFQTLFKEQEANVKISAKYNKETSFYDSLSRNTSDKESPFDRQKQLQVDADTFGFDVHEFRGRGYRPRYRGRGYRHANQSSYAQGYSSYRPPSQQEAHYPSSGYSTREQTSYPTRGRDSHQQRPQTSYQPRGQATHTARGQRGSRREVVYYRRKA